MDVFHGLKAVKRTEVVAEYMKQVFRQNDIQAKVPIPIEIWRECHYIVKIVKEAIENHRSYRICLLKLTFSKVFI